MPCQRNVLQDSETYRPTLNFKTKLQGLDDQSSVVARHSSILPLLAAHYVVTPFSTKSELERLLESESRKICWTFSIFCFTDWNIFFHNCHFLSLTKSAKTRLIPKMAYNTHWLTVWPSAVSKLFENLPLDLILTGFHIHAFMPFPQKHSISTLDAISCTVIELFRSYLSISDCFSWLSIDTFGSTDHCTLIQILHKNGKDSQVLISLFPYFCTHIHPTAFWTIPHFLLVPQVFSRRHSITISFPSLRP